MKVELKKLKINLTFSRETIQFMADVYINGVKAATADNDGCGGSTNCRPIDRELCKQAEEYFKSQPKKHVMEIDFSYDQNLETAIDDLVDIEMNRKETEKYKKKLQKAMLDGLVFNKGEEGEYQSISWNGHTIKSLLTHNMGRDAINKKVAELKSQGYIILNANLHDL